MPAIDGVVDDAAHLRRGGDAHDPDAALGGTLSSLEKDMTLAPPWCTSGASAVAEVPNSGPSTRATPSVRALR